MNNINNIANKISKIAFVVALVFVAWMLIQPETAAAGTDTAPSTRRITAMSRNTIRRVATVSAVNVVSTATEPVVPTNVVSSATEPTNTSKVRTTPRIQVTGSTITRK